MVALLIPTAVSHRTGRHRLNVILGSVVLAIITLSLIAALGFLIVRPAGKTSTAGAASALRCGDLAEQRARVRVLVLAF